MDDPLRRPFRFVKIDAQGGALNVLTGASRVLDVALGLEVEVELAPMYEGEPLLGDVDAYLRSRGFDLVDLRPTYWRREQARHVPGTRGQIVFCDVLYLLPPKAFAARVAAVDGEQADHLCASALLICSVYGLADWAAAYAAALGDRNPQGAMLREYVAARRSSWLPRFPLRYQLGLWLKDLGDRLIETQDTWGVAEQRLGSKPRLGHMVVKRLMDRTFRSSGDVKGTP
jgi:hypothetical protein